MNLSLASRQRLTSAIVAMALQGGIALLLVFSFPLMRRLTEERETILILPSLPRAAPAPPMVIDGRPRPGLRPSTVPLLPPPPAPSMAPQAAPPAPPPRSETLLRDLGRALADCGAGKAAAACPPPPAAPGKDQDLLARPQIKDEARWAAEKARRDAPTDAGIAVGPGIGFAIQDPLCKLARLFAGDSLKCGATPVYHTSTEAQFKAALDAVNARKRALSPGPVLASPGKTEAAHEKDGISGGPAAGPDAGGAAIPGR